MPICLVSSQIAWQGSARAIFFHKICPVTTPPEQTNPLCGGCGHKAKPVKEDARAHTFPMVEETSCTPDSQHAWSRAFGDPPENLTWHLTKYATLPGQRIDSRTVQTNRIDYIYVYGEWFTYLSKLVAKSSPRDLLGACFRAACKQMPRSQVT